MENGTKGSIKSGATRTTVVLFVGAVLPVMFLADLWLPLEVSRLQQEIRLSASQPSQLWVMSLLGLSFGMWTSQLLLLVAYAALGDGHSPRRILYTMFVLTLFTNACALFCMWWYRTRWNEVIGVFLAPLLLFFLLQIPVWGIRSYFGWTIVSPWSEPSERRPLQFTLAHLLGWSVFLAVPLCILQAMLSNGMMGFPVLAFCCWGVVVCALLMGLLYLGLATNMATWKFVFTAALSLLIAAALQCVGVWAWEGVIHLRIVVLLTAANLSGGALFLVCLRLARWLGFRLLPFDKDDCTRPTGRKGRERSKGQTRE